MKNNIDEAFKKRLLQHCLAIIRARADAARSAMDNAQSSANSEEKSSAGDKYETSRAMSHIEKDMHAKQLLANQNELAALLNIHLEKKYASVGNGCLVVCDDLIIFIAAGLGKMIFEAKQVFAISPVAPLAKMLSGKKEGDGFVVNGKDMLILLII